ncbi:Uncharacterised protein [Vibrio cholerae]|nr:Uncharacterised protein [Vibrio cholerae]CSA94873.1 Uncharacterised protein [Vibrio cholerae]CSC26915.1 Uncharacterised protein [Vibrio cholerae]CSC62244.1 Uncharacterised protein [Vibrio cholerae]CSC71289.1 Uncharacterised protein [Vibrio cholerae]
MQYPIDPLAQTQYVGIRLNMYIRGSHLNRIFKQRVDQFNNRHFIAI